MSKIMIFWIWTAAVLIALVLYFRQVYSRFSRHGVKHLRVVPILGHMTRVALRKEHFTEMLKKTYDAFPEERFVGNYQFMNPVVIIRDLDLVKNITVKDFEYFIDHNQLFNEDTEPFFGRTLLNLKGQDWKDMRSSLSPAFTSSKMRNMVPFMVDVGEQMIHSLKKKILDSGANFIDVEISDLTTRYANDVIASCAFGLKVNSHMEENNQFYKMGRAVSSFDFKQTIILFLNASFPKLMNRLNISVLSETIHNFFRSLVIDTMKDRETRQIIRPDMIHLLMEAKKGKLTHDNEPTQNADAGFATVEESNLGKKQTNKVWTDDEIIAQAIIFLVAGFETVSSTMTLLLHELTINPDVQEKLVQEINQNDIKNNGKFDYNSIQQLTYMDMVVSELLRRWPAVPILDRYCTKDCNIGRPNEKATEDYIVREGESLQIPTWGIHHDPQYFPNPFKFDPERFSEENKHKIKPFSYMPFGLGPRNCIGSRFALCEVKVMVYQLLQSMELSPNEKTQIGHEVSVNSFNLRLKNGHSVRLRSRN